MGDISMARFFKKSRRFKIEISPDTGMKEMSGFFSVRDFRLVYHLKLKKNEKNLTLFCLFMIKDTPKNGPIFWCFYYPV